VDPTDAGGSALERWSEAEPAPGGDRAGDEPSVVLHVDMDCFYASCERLREPALRGEPIVVGMGYEPGTTRGAVATASYEAREFGVESAQAISTALDRLPRRADADPGLDDPDAPDPDETGHYRPVDMEHYESVAADVKAVLRDCADVVREVSIDEAYLDASDRTGWEPVGGDGNGGATPAASSAAGPAERRRLAEGFARHVKARIERAAGVPASVGVAPDMATAKVASDHDKPDGLTVVPPDRAREFLAPLPVEAIHGVGPVTARDLGAMGIETAGDLAAADPDALTARFGERGRLLFDRARGADDREVTPTGRPKSLSRESAFPEATADVDRMRTTVAELAADVAGRARERGALYRTIGIKVVEPPFEVRTRARSLPGPVEDPDAVEAVALDLLGEFEGREVRKLGVRVANLAFDANDQATLSGFDGGGPTGAGTTAMDGDGDRDGDGNGGRLTDWVGEDPTAEGDPEAGPESGGSGPGPPATDGQSSLTEFD